MNDLAHRTLARRSLRACALFAVCVTLSGCYSCSLNGGWEGQMNPFCVEKNTLVGPLALTENLAPPQPNRARPIGSSPHPQADQSLAYRLVEPRGVEPLTSSLRTTRSTN